MDSSIIDALAREVATALRTGRQIPPFSSRYPDFSLTDAYRVAALLRDDRAARGELAVGRKIGFTNRTVWANHGISAPIWGHVYDRTVTHLAGGSGLFSLTGLIEPRIEPEIVVHLAAAPRADMSEGELCACIDWVAHGFEIVQSIFPGWVFTAADAVAAQAVHAALLVGKARSISGDHALWPQRLSSFTVELCEDHGIRRSGRGQDVLGSPLKALQFLLAELARDPSARRLAPGEIVTTGTLTEAMPVRAGEIWTTRLEGIDLEGLRLAFK